MTDICCGVVSESSSRTARRRRMDIRRFRFVAPAPSETDLKRQRLDAHLGVKKSGNGRSVENKNEIYVSNEPPSLKKTGTAARDEERPKYGAASVCGRRREMEDAVSVFSSESSDVGFHYFGVYDGHGCSHVATKCRERLHELVKEEVEVRKPESSSEWKSAMERSFSRMDEEVVACKNAASASNCRCELQMPDCDAVGSTAVVAVVTSDQIVVANCGDSRAVLSRKGKALPLSDDHKPDRADELKRIEEAGGRVIYWDGARVLGVLAMSRAIGDSYLKPYVTCEPEVRAVERSPGDECLVLASDGLWDVVSNETACGVARMYLKGKKAHAPPGGDGECSDAAVLLTKLALARHSGDNVSVVVVDLKRRCLCSFLF